MGPDKAEHSTPEIPEPSTHPQSPSRSISQPNRTRKPITPSLSSSSHTWILRQLKLWHPAHLPRPRRSPGAARIPLVHRPLQPQRRPNPSQHPKSHTLNSDEYHYRTVQYVPPCTPRFREGRVQGPPPRSDDVRAAVEGAVDYGVRRWQRYDSTWIMRKGGGM